MSIIRIAGRVRPTRGELIKLNKQLQFLQEGLEVFTMKKDQLIRDLQVAIKNISRNREKLEERLREAYGELIAAYMTLGSSEIEIQAASLQGTLKVRVLAKSIMGTPVPRIDIVSRPNFKGKIGTVEYGVARRFHDLLDDLMKVAEMESEIMRVADDLRKTNSKVNALEKIVIPELKGEIKYIEDRLEEEALEEFTRMKIIKEVTVRRRS